MRLVMLLFIGFLLIPATGVCNLPTQDPRHSEMVRGDDEPDTSKSRRLTRWATKAEWEQFLSVGGMSKRKILERIGHPSFVRKRSDGSERWWYDWGVNWFLEIENGVCVATFTDDGY
jgi:hypothetical protein